MKKNWKIIVICCCILLLLVGFSVLKEVQERIPSNDISVTGNTGGNLNNHGLFAEADGRVYFSNAYDSGCLYSMNPDETDLKSSPAVPLIPSASGAITSTIIWTMQPVERASVTSYIPTAFTAANWMEAAANA